MGRRRPIRRAHGPQAAMNHDYVDTVRLLLAMAPAVFASGRFAMKGGTALNLFVQEMPCLSVDIDLAFVDHRPDRQGALQAIAQELATVQAALARKGYRVHLPANTEGEDVKLVVSNDTAQVKVEVNFVFRGTTLPVETRSLVGIAQDLITTDLAVAVLATAELYGSKLVAAMDRQHPRDIFDVMCRLDHFGWQASFVDCFVAYLAGHSRPVHEVLLPKTKPLEPAFTNEFAGMTRDTVELNTLVQMQVRLLQELPQQSTPAHRDFLLSLVQGEPVWELMPMQRLRELPALKWKLMNLAKLKKNSAKRRLPRQGHAVPMFRRDLCAGTIGSIGKGARLSGANLPMGGRGRGSDRRDHDGETCPEQRGGFEEHHEEDPGAGGLEGRDARLGSPAHPRRGPRDPGGMEMDGDSGLVP